MLRATQPNYLVCLKILGKYMLRGVALVLLAFSYILTKLSSPNTIERTLSQIGPLRGTSCPSFIWIRKGGMVHFLWHSTHMLVSAPLSGPPLRSCSNFRSGSVALSVYLQSMFFHKITRQDIRTLDFIKYTKYSKYENSPGLRPNGVSGSPVDGLMVKGSYFQLFQGTPPAQKLHASE